MEYQPFTHLLLKQLGEPLSPEEQRTLDQWLAASPLHQKVADDYRRWWYAIPETDPDMPKPDVERALQTTLQKIKASDAKKQNVVVPFRYWGRVAAAVAVVLIALVGYLYLPNESYTTLSAGQADRASFSLPDGSVVWLRKGSTLRFQPSMTGKERLVTLQGEGFFEVTPNPDKPFRIAMHNGAEVKVLGTSFNVRTSDASTTVTVKTGAVAFTALPQQEPVRLQAGQRAVFDPERAKVKVDFTHTYNDMAWQRGGLVFEDTPLKEVISDLENYYDVQITLANPKIADCKYSYSLVSLPVEKVLENLCRSYQMQLNNPAANQYVLTGGTCL